MIPRNRAGTIASNAVVLKINQDYIDFFHLWGIVFQFLTVSLELTYHNIPYTSFKRCVDVF